MIVRGMTREEKNFEEYKFVPLWHFLDSFLSSIDLAGVCLLTNLYGKVAQTLSIRVTYWLNSHPKWSSKLFKRQLIAKI